MPLSFKALNSGNYTIAIDHVDGLFSGEQKIILRDNDNGIETDLNAGAYTFTAPAGTTNTRFSLKYQKTLGIISSVLTKIALWFSKTRVKYSLNQMELQLRM